MYIEINGRSKEVWNRSETVRNCRKAAISADPTFIWKFVDIPKRSETGLKPPVYKEVWNRSDTVWNCSKAARLVLVCRLLWLDLLDLTFASLDLGYLSWVLWPDLICSSDVFTFSGVYVHIWRRICDGESPSIECHHLGSQETPFVKTWSVVFKFSFCLYVLFKKDLQSEIHDLRSGETFPRKKKFVLFWFTVVTFCFTSLWLGRYMFAPWRSHIFRPLCFALSGSHWGSSF